jgi:hypothetical protein
MIGSKDCGNPYRKVVISMRHAALGSLALATLVASLTASVASGGTLVNQRAAIAAGHCKAVGKGTAWSYQGQKGTAYTVEGSKASACAVGIKWLARLTNMVGVTKTPPGWDCVAAVAVAGQCQNKSGAVFEWTAKSK